MKLHCLIDFVRRVGTPLSVQVTLCMCMYVARSLALLVSGSQAVSL